MNVKLEKIMNEQIVKEFASAYLYLSMAAYFENKGLVGCAKWMKVQAKEEIEHGMKFFNYLAELGCQVSLTAIEKPETGFKSIKEVFEKTLAHEKMVTASIHNLVTVSEEVKDYGTKNFLQWFVDEQVEEEKNPTDILIKLQYIKEDSMGVILLDKELGSRA